jgi:two-component system, OmpR family, response regulator MtrA
MYQHREAISNILIVDPDSATDIVETELRERGHVVFRARSGREGQDFVRAYPFDLVIFELMVPDIDGLVFWTQLRREYSGAAIVYSGTRRARDVALLRNLGVDDFVTKLVRADTLAERVERVLRRARRSAAQHDDAPDDRVRVGTLAVDRVQHRVSVGPFAVTLTPTEFKLINVLACRPEKAFSRAELARLVWDVADAFHDRTVDVNIQRLRAKLGATPAPPPRIETVRGIGYRLTVA